MKKKHRALDRFQTMPKDVLASLKGGGNDDEIIVYINGKPYRIIVNGDGTTTYVPV